MDRNPGDFRREEASDADPPFAPGTPVANMSDDELSDWIGSLPPCPGLPETEEEIAEADARAEADIAAGRVYPHSVVSAWLDTWGKPGRQPFREWLKSSG